MATRKQSDKPMSVAFRKAARSARSPSGGYLQPGRVGKRLVAGHFDDQIAQNLRQLANARDVTVQALLEEAITDLLRKHARQLERYKGLSREFKQASR